MSIVLASFALARGAKTPFDAGQMLISGRLTDQSLLVDRTLIGHKARRSPMRGPVGGFQLHVRNVWGRRLAGVQNAAHQPDSRLHLGTGQAID